MSSIFSIVCLAALALVAAPATEARPLALVSTEQSLMNGAMRALLVRRVGVPLPSSELSRLIRTCSAPQADVGVNWLPWLWFSCSPNTETVAWPPVLTVCGLLMRIKSNSGCQSPLEIAALSFSRQGVCRDGSMLQPWPVQATKATRATRATRVTRVTRAAVSGGAPALHFHGSSA